ncbi:MAG: imidazolonepropionase [Bdellovibrionales bacterium]|nr:imidazolonepropionase [Bdellovibrionales bacterium]
MIVFKNIKEIVSLSGVAKKLGKNISSADLDIIENGCIVENNGKIVWIGSFDELPNRFKKCKTISLKQKTILPSFVECHTHTVFAGNRSTEFELRQQGVSYQEIAKRGGGIKYTVEETRKATEASLKRLAQNSAKDFLRQGVTTLEIKSGYGLDFKNEVKILKTAKSLKGPDIITTYLGPHAVPKEHKNADEYIKTIIADLPKIKNYAKRVDIFVEGGYFSIEQAKMYFKAANALGFQIVVHADQMSRTGASVLAAELGALSCDHVIHITDDDIQSLAVSTVTAVLLPTSDQYLQIPYPKARKLLNAGVRVALATDYNPGTSPTRDVSYVGVLARVEMKMLLHEVIAAYTYNAACALGLESKVGSLEVGKHANFVVVENYQDLFYQVGWSPVEQVYKNGKRMKL